MLAPPRRPSSAASTASSPSVASARVGSSRSPTPSTLASLRRAVQKAASPPPQGYAAALMQKAMQLRDPVFLESLLDNAIHGGEEAVARATEATSRLRAERKTKLRRNASELHMRRGSQDPPQERMHRAASIGDLSAARAAADAAAAAAAAAARDVGPAPAAIAAASVSGPATPAIAPWASELPPGARKRGPHQRRTGSNHARRTLSAVNVSGMAEALLLRPESRERGSSPAGGGRISGRSSASRGLRSREGTRGGGTRSTAGTTPDAMLLRGADGRGGGDPPQPAAATATPPPQAGASRGPQSLASPAARRAGAEGPPAPPLELDGDRQGRKTPTPAGSPAAPRPRLAVGAAAAASDAPPSAAAAAAAAPGSSTGGAAAFGVPSTLASPPLSSPAPEASPRPGWQAGSGGPSSSARVAAALASHLGRDPGDTADIVPPVRQTSAVANGETVVLYLR